MRNSISFALMILFSLGGYAQFAVTDPTAVAQRASISLSEIDEQLEQKAKLMEQIKVAKESYRTSKDFYSQYQKVSNSIRGMEAVYNSYQVAEQMTGTYRVYKNGIRKDKYLTPEEKLSAITSCVLLIEGASSDLKKLKKVVSDIGDDGFRMSDTERIKMIEDINKNLNQANYAMYSFYGRIMSISKHRQYDNQVRSLILYGKSKKYK